MESNIAIKFYAYKPKFFLFDDDGKNPFEDGSLSVASFQAPPQIASTASQNGSSATHQEEAVASSNGYVLDESQAYADTPITLVECPICSRKFAAERIEKHKTICQKSAQKKKRKVFDSTAMRLDPEALKLYKKGELKRELEEQRLKEEKAAREALFGTDSTLQQRSPLKSCTSLKTKSAYKSEISSVANEVVTLASPQEITPMKHSSRVPFKSETDNTMNEDTTSTSTPDVTPQKANPPNRCSTPEKSETIGIPSVPSTPNDTDILPQPFAAKEITPTKLDFDEEEGINKNTTECSTTKAVEDLRSENRAVDGAEMGDVKKESENGQSSNSKSEEMQTPQKSYALDESQAYADTPITLVECPICSRKFAAERIEKHKTICQKSAQKKKRKVFDSTAMRLDPEALKLYKKGELKRELEEQRLKEEKAAREALLEEERKIREQETAKRKTIAQCPQSSADSTPMKPSSLSKVRSTMNPSVNSPAIKIQVSEYEDENNKIVDRRGDDNMRKKSEEELKTPKKKAVSTETRPKTIAKVETSSNPEKKIANKNVQTSTKQQKTSTAGKGNMTTTRKQQIVNKKEQDEKVNQQGLRTPIKTTQKLGTNKSTRIATEPKPTTKRNLYQQSEREPCPHCSIKFFLSFFLFLFFLFFLFIIYLDRKFDHAAFLRHVDICKKVKK